MVRSLVSAGAALTCVWSVLFGLVQAATINTDGQATQGANGNPSAGNTGIVINLPPGTVIIPYDITFEQLTGISAGEHLPSPLFPVPEPPSPFPAPKARLTFKKTFGSLIADRRGVSVFEGIIENGPNGQSGYARFVLNRAGKGSVSVSLNGEPKRVIPVGVDASGALSSNNADTSVSGQLTTSSDGSVSLDAVIDADGQLLPVKALRAGLPQEAIDAVKGNYTLIFNNQTSGVLLLSGMTGLGTVRVNKRGSVTFSGRLSDGNIFSQGTSLNSAGKWPLFSKGRGGTVLGGTVSFADLADSDCSGTLQWRRPVGQIVGNNETATVSLRGSFYSPAEAFGDVSQWNFTAFSMSGSTQASATLAQAPRNALQLNSSTAEKAKATLTKANGRLSGGFFHSGNPFRQTITGVLFQKTNQGFGFTAQPPIRGPLATPRVSSMTSGAMMAWFGRFTLNAVAVASAAEGIVTNNAENSNSPAATPEVGGNANPQTGGTSTSDSSSAGFIKSGVGTLVLAGNNTISEVIVAAPEVNLSIPTGGSLTVSGSINFTSGGIPTSGSVLLIGGIALPSGGILLPSGSGGTAFTTGTDAPSE